MIRHHLSFNCKGLMLVGTLDDGGGDTGVLVVSGGNEIRSGAFAGQALLAERLAGTGIAVFRFDRRGVGDSEGANGEFLSAGPDIAAALAAFRAARPGLKRIAGFGNCDAASALMLAKGAGLDALVLANPWTLENEEAPLPPAAIRDHYRQRLNDPRAILRLLGGKVSPGKLISSLRDAMRPPPPPTSLAQDMAAGIAQFPGNVRFLLAERDRTAQAFLSVWTKEDQRIRRCSDATHGFVEPHAREWLTEQLLDVLRP